MTEGAQDFEITVLTGLNAGVSLGLNAGRHSIGGAPDDDIQLDGVNETLARFILKQNALKIKPLAGPVTAQPDQTLPEGEISDLKLPARIALTPEIEIFADRAAKARKPGRYVKPLLAVAGVVCAAVIISAFEINMRLTPTQATPTPPSAQIAATGAARTNAPTFMASAETGAGSCTNCAADAAESLRAGLEAAGLTSISVSQTDGAVRIEGNLAERDVGLWQDLRHNFDAQWPNVPLLISFTDAAEGAPFAIASLWLEEPREVRTLSDDVFMVGDRTPHGWLVSAIEDGYVELTQGDVTMRVTY